MSYYEHLREHAHQKHYFGRKTWPLSLIWCKRRMRHYVECENFNLIVQGNADFQRFTKEELNRWQRGTQSGRATKTG